MTHFRAAYDSLPDEAKDAILACVYKALMWRGWDESADSILGKGEHARLEIQNIAKILSDNGHSMEEYT